MTNPESDMTTDPAESADGRPARVRTGRGAKLVLLASAAVLLAAGSYAWWRDYGGGPGRGDDLAAATAGAGAGAMLAALETATKAEPDNSAAWQALASARFDMGDYAGAARDLETAAKLDPDNSAIWSALGEALASTDPRNPMPPAALTAFQRAARINPRDPRARYYLAVKRDLDGDHAGAIADWLALLADTPAGAPWEASLRQTIADVGAANDVAVTARMAAVRQPPPPGRPAAGPPAGAAADAVAAMPPAEQSAMIAQMVGGLESRLQAQPGDVEGWEMLMRSRMALGEGDKAAKALADAVRANPGAAAQLSATAATLGVPGA